uniref:(northern house mosquito) hypothetical protein n=1 Tax=Culex pipiens TaxID=7175 RepID=A0A8D8F565_CULPI
MCFCTVASMPGATSAGDLASRGRFCPGFGCRRLTSDIPCSRAFCGWRVTKWCRNMCFLNCVCRYGQFDEGLMLQRKLPSRLTTKSFAFSATSRRWWRDRAGESGFSGRDFL